MDALKGREPDGSPQPQQKRQLSPRDCATQPGTPRRRNIANTRTPGKGNGRAVSSGRHRHPVFCQSPQLPEAHLHTTPGNACSIPESTGTVFHEISGPFPGSHAIVFPMLPAAFRHSRELHRKQSQSGTSGDSHTRKPEPGPRDRKIRTEEKGTCKNTGNLFKPARHPCTEGHTGSRVMRPECQAGT